MSPFLNKNNSVLLTNKWLLFSAITLACQSFGVSALNSSGDGIQQLSEVPLSISQGVKPNVLITMDDSASMRHAYAGFLGAHQRKSYSAFSNELYYDPEIEYQAPVKPDGSLYQTSWNRALIDGYNADVNSDSHDDFIDLETGYRPTRMYPHDRNNPASHQYAYHPDDAEFSGKRDKPTKAYYYTFKTGCSISQKGNNHCYQLNFVENSEKQNFANWYSFYRTRKLTAQTATILSFYDQQNLFRFAWQGLMTCFISNAADKELCKGSGNKTLDNSFQPFTAEHRANFLDWMRHLPLKNSTPTREAYMRAGEIFKDTSAKGPYAAFSEDGTARAPTSLADKEVASCRRNYQLLITDGEYTTSSYPSSGHGKGKGSKDFTTATEAAMNAYYGHTDAHNTDNTKFTLGDGKTTYTPSAESSRAYRSTSGKTLSDLAFYYWAHDLSSTLENNVNPLFRHSDTFWDARNNPSDWQNLSTYVLAFGLSSSLSLSDAPEWGGGTYSGGFAELLSGSKNWPTYGDGGGNVKKKVYDLWHTAINSRGEFYSISNSDSFKKAIANVLDQINKDISTDARASFSGATIATANLAFNGSFNSGDWTGDVGVRNITNRQNRVITDNDAQAASFSKALTNQNWQSRNIYLGRTNDTGSSLVNFSWDKLNDIEKNLLNQGRINLDNLGKERVNWIRGKRNNPKLRGATQKLADLINAAPVYVGAPESLSLKNMPGDEGSSYATFVKNNKNRSARLYIAGNGGMLHSANVDASQLNPAQTAFKESSQFFQETFSYIPSLLLSKLPRLTDLGYTHQYYLDVTPIVEDVYFDNQWHTVLIGGMRGARGVYALDITNPDAVKLLWEISDKDAALLGHTFNSPSIARLNDGKWYALIPNGYDNINNGIKSAGTAALIVVDIETGAISKTLDTGIGSETQPNGLGPVALADVNGDMITDYAYAGDLFGNLWRFDFVNSSASEPFSTGSSAQWKVGLEEKPLFTAIDSDGDPQPITSKPSIVKHYLSDHGHIVLFGTGKFLEKTDRLNAANINNSFYGIWDQKTDGKSSQSVNITRANLFEHTITSEAQESFGADSKQTAIRTTTQHAPNWRTASNSSGHLGWFIDLTYKSQPGEMVIYEAITRGRLLIFQSNQISSSPCSSASLATWIYGVNPVTGSRVVFPQFDLSKDDKLDSNDQILILGNPESISAFKLNNLGAINIIGDYIYFSTENGNIDKIRYQSGPYTTGRQNWQRLR